MNLIKIFCITLLLFFTFGNLKSQNKSEENNLHGKITGQVVDKDSLFSLPGATLSLYKYSDSTIQTGAVADKKGNFEIKEIPFGKYSLKVSYIGYSQKFIKNLEITALNSTLDLGQIGINLSISSTDEVKVTAEKPQMEFSAGKKIFNIDKDIASSGGNAIDVLKNLPSVEVDIDNNVSLRGSSSVQFLINGKPSTMLSSGTSALEQIPASMIENIEIITNPTAKFDAEGTAGIININLKKEGNNGLNGIASINAGTYDRYSASVNLNYKIDGINISGGYDYYGSLWGMDGNSFRKTIIADSTTEMYQNFFMRHRHLTHSVKGGIEYNINNANQLIVSGSYRGGNSDRKGESNNVSNNLLKSVIDKSNSKSGEISTSPNIDLSMNYRHTFSKFHELTFDAFYSTDNDDENTVNNQYFTRDSTRLEAGVKASLKTMDNDYQNLTRADSTSEWILDVLKSNHYIYHENVYSAYLIFSNKVGDLSYSAGLRVEQTVTKGEQKTISDITERNYLDFFPNLSFGYRFSINSEVQLSYSRRIERPRSWFLNPFIEYMDYYNVRYGNPELKPQYTHAFELGLLNNFTKFSVTPSIFYNRTTDVFDRFSELLDDGKMGMTWKNMSSRYSYGLEVNFSGDPLQWLRISLDGSYYKYIVEGLESYSGTRREDFSWNTRLNATISPMKELNFQLSGNYMAPSENIQGKRFASWGVDIGTRYEMLENLTLTFRASDIFHTQKWHTISSGENFYSDSNILRMSQYVSFGIQYKINQGIKQRQRLRNGDGGFEDEGMF
ncbi:MAG: TonB-dependent receptor [Ignavibacteriae bacterium]|nr:TonB-dependent receptor [Ignavibacteriota bacterium]